MGIPPGLPMPEAMREMRSRRVGSCCDADVNAIRRPAPQDEGNPSGRVDGGEGWIVVRVWGVVVVSCCVTAVVTERGGRGYVGSE